jgi:hypothetical protein
MSEGSQQGFLRNVLRFHAISQYSGAKGENARCRRVHQLADCRRISVGNPPHQICIRIELRQSLRSSSPSSSSLIARTYLCFEIQIPTNRAPFFEFVTLPSVELSERSLEGRPDDLPSNLRYQ